ncbi:MAG: hypothetical protein QOH88_3342 [Verrucomicrobiota bacterium]|jgi:hypothetical protein
MESAGLKEWALVCEAMGRGEQCVILRKGGIAEGRAGFAFRHDEFFLFPTFFHEQVEKVRIKDVQIPTQQEDAIEIRFFANVIQSAHLTSWETVAALEPFHVLQESVIRERFEYDQAAGLHLAFLRVFRLAPAWIFPDAPKYGGCRSWVPLPKCPEETQFEPVLSDAQHEERQRRLWLVLGL